MNRDPIGRKNNKIVTIDKCHVNSAMEAGDSAKIMKRSSSSRLALHLFRRQRRCETRDQTFEQGMTKAKSCQSFATSASSRTTATTEELIDFLECQVEEARASSGRNRLRKQKRVLYDLESACRCLELSLAGLDGLQVENRTRQGGHWFLGGPFVPIADRADLTAGQEAAAVTEEDKLAIGFEIRLRTQQCLLLQGEYESEISHSQVPRVLRRLACLWALSDQKSDRAMLCIEEALEWCSPQGSTSNKMCLRNRRREEYFSLRLKAVVLERLGRFDAAIVCLKQAHNTLERIEITASCKPPNETAHRVSSHLDYHQEQCSVKLELASLYVQTRDQETAIETLSECCESNIPGLTRDNVVSASAKQPVLSMRKLVKIAPARSEQALSMAQDDVIVSASVHASLGMILLTTKKDTQRAAVLLHKSLELSWKVFNLTNDIQAKRMSRYLFGALEQATDNNGA
eukprot:CAMPEP_0168726286 /NCGR_PEP_ID=MMETSP0724-20121128/4590_1 /TAXON_ID=265536 /ORGANISM="Amphiprora sp., Strain CCMP467" /LENGTH=458 /DNA_ID=CAMNT_0008773095 /DNA_START=41 /DNA_END=1417 /DNA_ORIENTATION=-